MSHHNISHSEAGRPRAHIQIREGRKRRARPRTVVAAHVIAACVGVMASLADIAIGRPVCLIIVTCAFLAWCVWPSR